MSGILYVTGTPIGNLSDLSPRAAQTLESVDFIAAEDTRVTLKLLNHLGIKKPMVSYFEHNKRERGEIICRRIDAFTPSFLHREQTPEGGPHAKVGLKQQLSPRVHASKKENPNSPLAAAQTTN